MKAVDSIEKFIFRSPTWKLTCVVVLITLVKTGVWYNPLLKEYQLIAQNPFINPFGEKPIYHSLYWNWLGPFLAWAVGANSSWSFFLFNFVFSIAFTALFIRTVFLRLSDRDARVTLILFFILPVSATAYFWVSIDSITLFLMLCAFVYPNSYILLSLFGVLLGMHHFEQAFFGFSGLLLALLLSRRYKSQTEYTLRWVLVILAGVIAGKSILYLIFYHFGISVNVGKLYFLEQRFTMILYQFLFRGNVIFWSILGLGWILVIKYFEKGKSAIPFLLPLLGLMCLLLPISRDQTRVLVIVTFPLVAAYWLFNREYLNSIDNRFVAWLFLLWLVVPWGWVLGGVPRWSAFPYDVAYLLHRLFGWFDVPADLSTWPYSPFWPTSQ